MAFDQGQDLVAVFTAINGGPAPAGAAVHVKAPVAYHAQAPFTAVAHSLTGVYHARTWAGIAMPPCLATAFAARSGRPAQVDEATQVVPSALMDFLFLTTIAS